MWKRKKAAGSFTVEAAIIVPVVLGCILLVLNMAIQLYTEVTACTVYSGWWQELEPADEFRKLQLWKSIEEIE